MNQMVVPQGEFQLARYPVRPKETLRAWDAADEYLLAHLAELAGQQDELNTSNVVVMNGGAGALACALAPLNPTVISDSYVDRLATLANLSTNGIDASQVELAGDFDSLKPKISLLVIKLPKNQSLLEDQLHRLRPLIDADTVILGGAMSKHVHTSTLELFERILGPTTTTLARRKARLVIGSVDPELDPGNNPWPATRPGASAGHLVTSFANAFGSGKLDAGTRFLLEHLPRFPDARSIIDLGCGSGDIGLALALANPEAEILCVDESYAAVASTRATLGDLSGDKPADRVRVDIGDCLFALGGPVPVEVASVDVIVTNPPFHDDHALSDATAWQMFSEARSALRPGGELWVVGNRHLAYHAKLKRIFGNCKVVESNSKFVLFRATRASGPKVVSERSSRNRDEYADGAEYGQDTEYGNDDEVEES